MILSVDMWSPDELLHRAHNLRASIDWLQLIQLLCLYTALTVGSNYTELDVHTPNAGLPIVQLYAAIQEELPVGTTVVDLTSHPSIRQLFSHPDDTYNPMEFFYQLMNTFDSYLFRVKSHSGQLSVATRLDREALCANQKAKFCCNPRAQIPLSPITGDRLGDIEPLPRSQLCHLVVHINLQTRKQQSLSDEMIGSDGFNRISRLALIYLYIRLDDINDHTPQFLAPVTILNVPEDTSVGSVLHYFRITDPDVATNGLNEIKLKVTPLTTASLQIAGKSEETSVSSKINAAGNPFTTELNRDGTSLILAYELDREAVAAYDVTLTAVDGDARQPRSSQLSLRVTVIDVNDNAPTWIYQRKQSQTENAEWLLLDGKANIQFNTTVREDAQIGTLVYWLHARDSDQAENGRLQYAIDEGAPGGIAALDYFSVQTSTGEVRLRAQLDYDSTSSEKHGPHVDIPVIVRDSPRVGRSLSARAILHVELVDVNDVHPIIIVSPLSPVPIKRNLPYTDGTHSQSPFCIWENQPPGQPVATVLVSDPDTGDGGKVSCTIRNQFFRLISETTKVEYYDSPHMNTFNRFPKSVLVSGTVTYQLISTHMLDREDIPRHQILLTCRDHDIVQPLTSTRRIEIDVLDENDNSPQFSESPIRLYCREGNAVGQVIGRLNATDEDTGENSQLRFWTNDESTNWISVQPRTGEIRVNTVFDRETETMRRFIAFVADGTGHFSHTVSAEVIVTILDENDHSPQFRDLYFFTIAENSQPGTEVGRINAEDEDEGDNGKVHYLLLHPSREFELDQDSGVLKVRSSKNYGSNTSSTESRANLPEVLDRELQDTYELTVIAEDGGTPPRRASAVIHITVSDVNDNTPKFRFPVPHGPGSVLNVSCAQLSNQVIAKVVANDSDIGRNGEIEYSILRVKTTYTKAKRFAEDDDAILLVTELGRKSTERPRETRETASWNYTTSSVTAQSASARNESGTGSRSTKSATVSDYLLQGITNDHFEINSYNGQLFLIHPVSDCSQPAEFQLTLKAQDSGIPPRSSTAILTIRVDPSSEGVLRKSTNVFYPGNALGSRSDMSRKPLFSTNWHSKTIMADEEQRRKLASQFSDPAAQQFTFSSQWSAVVGLVVAMVILVLLLCLTLIVFRRNFVTGDWKLTRSKEPGADRKVEVPWVDPVCRGTYSGDSRGTISPNELLTGSPRQSSLSPATITQVDELSYSASNLEVNPSTRRAQYFCTMPGTSTLNPGIITVLHHDGRSVVNGRNERARNPAFGLETPGSVFGRMLSGKTCEHRGPMISTAGYTYQTLQPSQTRSQQTELFRVNGKAGSQNNTDYFRRNVLVDTKACTNCAKDETYMHLLHHNASTGKDCVLKQLQNSQPDLSKHLGDKTTGIEVNACNWSTGSSAQLTRDRAFSLTDLTYQQYNDKEEYRNVVKECKEQTSKARTGKFVIIANDQPGVGPSKVHSTKPYAVVPKSIMMEIGPHSNEHTISTYSVSSFV